MYLLQNNTHIINVLTPPWIRHWCRPKNIGAKRPNSWGRTTSTWGAVWLNTSPAALASPAPLSTSSAGDVCRYYIGPSMACLCCPPPLPLLLSGVLIGGGGYMTAPPRSFPAGLRSRLLLDAQSACPSADRWSHSHAIEVTRRCYIINGRWCRQWRRWGRWCSQSYHWGGNGADRLWCARDIWRQMKFWIT